MSKPATILVVDDDADVRELLEDFLGDKGYRVISLDSAESLRAELDQQAPDLVLLDVGLPGEDGLSLARHIRERFNFGIIMISGAGETLDRIIGLEVGADDYVAKPFDLRELHARVKSVLGRYREKPAAATKKEQAGQLIDFGVGRLDLQRHQLLAADGGEIPLTAMEFATLKVFSERPDRPLSRDQLSNLTQHRDWDPYDRSIDIRCAASVTCSYPNPEHRRHGNFSSIPA
jgi:two-component system phosphate regulon response regulator OmpR